MGHHARVLRSQFCQVILEKDSSTLLYKAKPFPKYDVFIVRAGMFGNVELEVSLLKQIQLTGIPVVNEYLPILRAKNKLRSLQILSHDGVPIPRTTFVNGQDYVEESLKHIGSYPIIIKSPFGSFGKGVAIAESQRAARSALDLFRQTNRREMLLLQEFVKDAKRKDIRVFVVDGKVIASMERTARKGEFRANVHQGGKTITAQLSPDEVRFAIQATKSMGLDYAGVDILRTNAGPKIIEVNANPGLEGITQATGINVAEAIVRFAVQKVKKSRRKKSKPKA